MKDINKFWNEYNFWVEKILKPSEKVLDGPPEKTYINFERVDMSPKQSDEELITTK